MTAHWNLVQSGKVLGDYGTIHKCMDEVRRLNPTAKVVGIYANNLLYHVTVTCNNNVTYYTLIWRCPQ